MRLLLDTHVLLWWQADAPQLGPETRELVADPSNDVLVSAVSIWEVAIKKRVGKMDVDLDGVERLIKRDRFTVVGISTTHLRTLVTLPMPHRDPFDHLLIAQAITEDALFLSNDRHVRGYPVRHRSCTA